MKTACRAATQLLAFLAAGILGVGFSAADESIRPNIVIFYLDDMGYGDPGCYGGKLAPTPHIDSLAAGGVRFTDGYVSACVCAPSRLALMTGRYQARSGHDSNFGRPGTEPPLTDRTIGDLLKSAGYATGLGGKWHLGSGPKYLPAARGFDFSIGSVGNLGEGGEKTGFFRGTELVETLEGAPITSPIYAREACKFIEANQKRPFLLHVAFNAVHNPNVASESVLKRFPHLAGRQRDYAACIAEADDAIGTVLDKLRTFKLEERTLIFCISDNGDSSPHANTEGLRGHKWTLWEGGIREPWLVQWKGRIPAGKVIHEPVIQLDVLPTALAAAGAKSPDGMELDGVNLLPLLEGKAAALNREAFYWRFGPQFAIRQGQWKLVKASREMEPMLIDLVSDRGEQKDQSLAHPEKKAELQTLWNGWNARMSPAGWEDRRADGEESRKARRQKK